MVSYRSNLRLQSLTQSIHFMGAASDQRNGYQLIVYDIGLGPAGFDTTFSLYDATPTGQGGSRVLLGKGKVSNGGSQVINFTIGERQNSLTNMISSSPSLTPSSKPSQASVSDYPSQVPSSTPSMASSSQSTNASHSITTSSSDSPSDTPSLSPSQSPSGGGANHNTTLNPVPTVVVPPFTIAPAAPATSRAAAQVLPGYAWNIHATVATIIISLAVSICGL
jgi:hypothetical protein